VEEIYTDTNKEERKETREGSEDKGITGNVWARGLRRNKSEGTKETGKGTQYKDKLQSTSSVL